MSLTKAEWADNWRTALGNNLSMGANGPGGAVYMFHGEDIVLQGGFGMASVANQMPFTTQTPCGIRSVTKTLTAAITLRAHFLGWMSWQYPGGILDREIGEFPVISNNIHRWTNKYIPPEHRDWNLPGSKMNKPPVHTNCTLRDLACHNSWIWAISAYSDFLGNKWPVYGLRNESGQYDNAFAHKNLMETIESVDDLVAQAGAVLGGLEPSNFAAKRANSPLALSYTDKAGWLEAAVCEEVLGNSWFNLVQEMFDHMGLENSYPSVDGNAQFIGQSNGKFKTLMKGHNANPIEVPGLAVAYTRGPTNPDGSGLGLFLEPEQSQESGYAIGCAVMSAADIATWGKEIRKSYWTQGGFLPPSVTAELFKVQTGAADKTRPYGGLQTVNWGLGIAKMVSVADSGGAELGTWGMVGAGGFGGYAGGIVFIPEADIVLAATSNTGIQPFGGALRDIVSDYAANFL